MLIQSDKMVFVPLSIGHRKEKCVKKFEILMPKPANHRYRPGDEISGSVELEVCYPMEICFLEFTVCGFAVACAIHAQQGLSLSKKETYMKKRVLVLGSSDGHTSTVVIPGRYTSKFNFKLPTNVPSSNIFEDKKGSLAFQIRYFVQARLCDYIAAASYHGHGSSRRRTLVRMLMSRHRDFIVERPFDIASVSMASWPISHTEEVVLGCAPFDVERSSLTASLDRSVYSSGDRIFVKFETDVCDMKHFKSIRCDLRQRVEIKRTLEVLYFIAATATVKDLGWKIERVESERPAALLKVNLQTTRDFLPSVLEGCDLLRVSYVVKIAVWMKHQAARMNFEVPLTIAPSNNTFPLALPDVTVPIFNRPMRFPRFSNAHKTLNPDGDSSGETSNPSNRSSDNSDYSSPKQVRICVQV